MKFTIFVTQKCNLRCKYCYEDNLDRRDDMSVETADKVIKFILERLTEKNIDRPLVIIFHGGEPLLNFDLVKYIREELENKVSDRKIIYHMTTNGTLINDENIDFLCKKIDFLSVSIDGVKKINDENRIFSDGSGTYDIVIKKLKSVLSRNKNIRIRMTITPETASDICKSITEIVNLGLTDIVVSMDYKSTEWENRHIEIIRMELMKLLSRKKNLKKAYINLIDLYSLNVKKGACFGGVVSYAIDVNGDLYPCTVCVGHKDMVIGNVHNNKVISEREIFAINYIDNFVCNECTRKEFCTTKRCKFINKVVTGKYENNIPIMCAMERISIDVSRMLQENIENQVRL
ncbi:radical SAM protein [Peptostreptococcus sp.]